MLGGFSLVLSCALVRGGLGPAAPEGTPRSDSLAELFGRGRPWGRFLEGVKANREAWLDNYAAGRPTGELVARARAVTGAWKVLVVAEDWCQDSANTIPYLARLVAELPTIELVVVSSKDGRWVMERHRTPDGRAATPTVLLLGADFEERGCFVETPTALRTLVAEWKTKLGESAWHERKAAWYRTDRGRETVTEFVAMLESAASGTAKCDASS